MHSQRHSHRGILLTWRKFREKNQNDVWQKPLVENLLPLTLKQKKILRRWRFILQIEVHPYGKLNNL